LPASAASLAVTVAINQSLAAEGVPVAVEVL
jgi:hypothetical protein